MDPVGADVPHDRLAKQEQHAQQADVRALYAHRLRGSPGKGDHPGAQGRFIVLSDRYIFTALARAGVRGVDRHVDPPPVWVRDRPHLVFYLRIDEKTLIRRVLQSRGMDTGNPGWT
jgi:thymidylate kinase